MSRRSRQADMVERCVGCRYYNSEENYCECNDEYLDDIGTPDLEYCGHAMVDDSLTEGQEDLALIYDDSDIDSIIEKFLQGKLD